MFRRTIELNVVKKSKKDDVEPEATVKEFIDSVTDTDKQLAAKVFVRYVGLQAVKWVAITTAISTAAKIAENRLSK